MSIVWIRGARSWRAGALLAAQIRRNATAATPLLEYDRRVSAGQLRDDTHQRRIIESLAHLHEQLAAYEPPAVRAPSPLEQVGWRTSALGRLFRRREQYSSEGVCKGIYLYGDVGCGKTMLMDLFYATVPKHLSKRRIHFHQFMQYVHRRSHEIVREQNLDALGEAKGRTIDPIPLLAAEIATQWRVLCFDEFQVTDVADAMILRRLLTLLLSNRYGVVLFTTSNRRPDELYMNGVQRESFLPCIELLKQRTEVIFLDSPTDYRKIPKPVSSVYYYPARGVRYRSEACEAERARHVKEWYDYFAQLHSEEQPVTAARPPILHDFRVNTWGRELVVPSCIPGRVAQFSFKQLCGQPLSAGDYLALANSFDAFIVTDIPYLSIFVRDEVRRFITFLDAVYDNGGKLATTGAASFSELFVEPEQLLNDYQLKEETQSPQKADESPSEIAQRSTMFILDEERFAFARALSRLSHMSTSEWVEKKRAE
ncbi:AaceriAAR132Cp [[Ashbya] aceris (nom. inval.)]|nr:AaceriAAR132Cp [[Ashbya] aceris (nom. inval.)]